MFIAKQGKKTAFHPSSHPLSRVRFGKTVKLGTHPLTQVVPTPAGSEVSRPVALWEINELLLRLSASVERSRER